MYTKVQQCNCCAEAYIQESLVDWERSQKWHQLFCHLKEFIFKQSTVSSALS